MRRVLYVSGSRADYGPVRHVLRAIAASPDLTLGILATGMHLDPMHGETWQEISADGFTVVDRVPGRIEGDSPVAMAATVGLYVYGMSQAIARNCPDIVLLLGDRGEQLAAAIAAAFQNIFVAHLCGGSLSGSIDDSVRHAITKFAHYHLPAFEEDAERIIQMGEDPATVRVVGLPGGDLRPDVTFSKGQICAQFDLPPERPYILVVQHGVTHSWNDANRQIKETLEAVAGLGYPTLLANPNDDAGGRVILQRMREYADAYPHLRVLPPPRSRELFASIMAHAGVLVGNSSSGIVEAMSVGLPVVNIGDRQRGREEHACLLCVGYDQALIRAAIQTALNDSEYRGRLAKFAECMARRNTAAEVVDVLRKVDLAAAARPKAFHRLREAATWGQAPLAGPR